MNTLELIDSILDDFNLDCYYKLISYITNNDFNNFIDYIQFIQNIKIDVKIKEHLTEYLYDNNTLKWVDNKYYIVLFKYIDYDILKQNIVKILIELYEYSDISFIRYFNKYNVLIKIINKLYNYNNITLLEILFKNKWVSTVNSYKNMFNSLMDCLKYNTVFYTIKNTSDVNLINYILIQKLIKGNNFNINDYYIIDYILKKYKDIVIYNKFVNDICKFNEFYNFIKNCNKFCDYPLIQKILLKVNLITFNDDNEIGDRLLEHYLYHFNLFNEFKYYIVYNKKCIQVSLLQLLILNPKCNNLDFKYIKNLIEIIGKNTLLMNENNIYNVYPIQLIIDNKRYNILENLLYDPFIMVKIKLNVINLEQQYNLIIDFIKYKFSLYTIYRMIEYFKYDVCHTFYNDENLMIMLLRYYDYKTVKYYFGTHSTNYGIIKWIQTTFDKV